MRVNMYYAPYPSQQFQGEEFPLSPVRVWNPKSALVTLAAGARAYLSAWNVDVEFKLIDTQVGGDSTYYKSIAYGHRTLDCYRVGGAFESYDAQIRAAEIHAISNNYTNSAAIVADFVKHIRSVKEDALIVVGGMDVTARPEFYIDNGADIVVQFEGEYVFAKLIEARAKGQPIPAELKGKPYGRGTIIDSGSSLDINELPPMSFDLVENLDLYTDTGEGIPPATVRPPYACFETSRGCYRTCSYCATPMRGRYRYMSPRTIERHLVNLKNAGINNILFQEDNILSRIQRRGKLGQGGYIHETGRAEVIEIFQMAREFGFSWEFANGLEFGRFYDPGHVDTELMEAMFWNDSSGDRWLGCYRTQISLEYLGESPTAKLPKLREFHEEIEILKAVLDIGVVHQTFNVIIGHDEDDERALRVYLDRCFQLKEMLHSHRPGVEAYFNIFNRTLLPGTQDYRKNAHRLEFDIDRDPEVISVYLAPMNIDNFKYHELVDRRIQMTSELNGALIDKFDGTLHIGNAHVL